jgi:hypothetical protein
MHENSCLSNKSKESLFRVLRDGKWHQVKDLIKESKISSKTFYKRLEELKPFIETKRETEKGGLKTFVYYRGNLMLIDMMFQLDYIQASWISVKNYFLKTKDLLLTIKMINDLTNGNLIIAFNFIQKKYFDITNPDIIKDFLEIFVQSTYKFLIENLFDFCIKTKIIDKITFDATVEDLMKKW